MQWLTLFEPSSTGYGLREAVTYTVVKGQVISNRNDDSFTREKMTKGKNHRTTRRINKKHPKKHGKDGSRWKNDEKRKGFEVSLHLLCHLSASNTKASSSSACAG